jgi:ketosteroid isomerase-like protein
MGRDPQSGVHERWVRLAVSAICLLALTTVAHAEEAPIAVVERFGKALESGDRAAVLDCLAPEVVIYEHGGAELSRDEYASHHLDGDLAYLAEIDVRVVDRKVLGGADRAIVLTRTEASGQYKGKPVASRGTETLVLERRGERWLIVHVHWSSGRSS